MKTEELYKKASHSQTRWASFENPTAGKGCGGIQNGGAKGMAFQSVEIGEEKVLMDVKEGGIINRIWMTVSDRSEEMLRGLILSFYWDNASEPAVCVPFGDFFCAQLGSTKAFENYFFSSPEGKSYNCFIQMPFLTGARVTLTNKSDKKLSHLFYDINFTLKPMEKENILYFHAAWNRENTTALCRDYSILGKTEGAGTFIGVCFGVRVNQVYKNTWFGEGEVKIYLDEDTEHPTLCGTGTEDYIGTGWGQGEYAQMSQGSLLSDEAGGRYVFYRLHVNDPIYFSKNIKVGIQNIGGASKENLLAAKAAGAPYKIVSCDNQKGAFRQLFNTDFVLSDESEDGWYNFYREDDYSSVAYFYLDRASL